MPKEDKFESDKQRKWYNATDQDFWDENKSVDDAIDDLEEIVEEHDLEEDEWESVDDASDYLFEHKVKKFCGIPERERDPNHPQPIPAAADGPEDFDEPERPEDIDRRRPKPPMAKWWNTVKAAGPVTTTAPGVKPGLINEAYGKGQQPPEEEEEEYPIIPEEPDFWRD